MAEAQYHYRRFKPSTTYPGPVSHLIRGYRVYSHDWTFIGRVYLRDDRRWICGDGLVYPSRAEAATALALRESAPTT